MQQITLKAYAKINLSLDVLAKRADGYHEVRMVMQQIDLADTVTVSYEEDGASGIHLTTSNPELPTDGFNIAYAAAELMAEISSKRGQPKPGSIRIHIDKNIPVSAGLAGGSTDAAAVIQALNALWSLKMPAAELMAAGKKLGADVPFCIMGNAGDTCALAEGIGEKLSPIRRADNQPLTVFKDCWILLSKPPLSVSTAKVYGSLMISGITERPDTEELIAGLMENNWTKISKNMINVLENVTLEEYCIVMYTKNKMRECDPKACLMSGSGPSIFGIFVDKSTAIEAFDVMKELNRDTYLVQAR